jgi:galactokinase
MNKELVRHITQKFKEQYQTNPLLSFAPGRINIIGEHTDYNDGYVFPAAIDKGIITALKKSESPYINVTALDYQESYQFSLDALTPIEGGGWKNYVIGIIAGIQKSGKQLSSFDMMFTGDIPKGAGLSSSAALENSIIVGLNVLFDLQFSKQEMIFIAQKAEHDFVGVQCGIMDQYASMFGQKDKALFLDCGTLIASPVTIDLGEYSFLLVNSKVSHSLAESAYNQRRITCEKISTLLKIKNLRDAEEADINTLNNVVSPQELSKALYVVQENHRVKEAVALVQKNDLIRLGKLLYKTHQGLQHQYQVSCKELDFLVDFTKELPEVLGARMMGGGFGGCMLTLIKTKDIPKFQKKIFKAYQKNHQQEASFYQVHLSNGSQIL